jgi:hypothetical protein
VWARAWARAKTDPMKRQILEWAHTAADPVRAVVAGWRLEASGNSARLVQRIGRIRRRMRTN